MRNKCEANHVLYRDGVYYYVRRVPHDLTLTLGPEARVIKMVHCAILTL